MLNLSTEGKAEKKGIGEEKQRKRSLKKYLLEKMQVWINGLLEAERDEFWGRGRHESLDEKHDNYRDGYRGRGINFFGLGRIELRVPRDRRGEFSSAWLPDRKGQDPELEAFLAEAFLAGCSTRDLVTRMQIATYNQRARLFPGNLGWDNKPRLPVRRSRRHYGIKLGPSRLWLRLRRAALLYLLTFFWGAP